MGFLLVGLFLNNTISCYRNMSLIKCFDNVNSYEQDRK